MAERITAEQVHAWFAAHMNERPDYGVGKALVDLMLHPRNPFNPKERRKFRGAFLWAIVWMGAAVCLFVYFNFAR